MPSFSANLGFLWQELSLPDAIRAAGRAGFDAVECHWPYQVDPDEVNAALSEAALPMLGLNTLPGNTDAGDIGLAAVAGREPEARQVIDQSVDYARSVGAGNIHVMAGRAEGARCEQAYIDNLRYACEQAAPDGINILIEPLNVHDAPGYFLSTTTQATAILDKVGRDNCRLMFDCYHVQTMEGDLTRRIKALLPVIGHIQFASVPDRAEPDSGELDFGYVFRLLDSLGYDHPLGAEYRPRSTTDEGLGWLQSLT